ncbi:MAG TPA: AIPR family protein [Pyrinomonadaceae bacterium]|jgi:hypothetical protein
MERKQLFDFMLDRVKEKARQTGLKDPQAFGKWFLEMYFLNPQDVFISDGSRDGKVDLFFTTHNNKVVEHHILNTKFTEQYDKTAPANFYEEVNYLRRAFDDKEARSTFLERRVKAELRKRYSVIFDRYDNDAAHLYFVTNYKRNDAQCEAMDFSPIRLFHLDELIQHMIDDIDAAMPRTQPMRLTGINSVLSPDKRDTEVSTSIVFARLIDFIEYMEDDKNQLLFARNVRLSLGNTSVNRDIRETFRSSPMEFAFSNNGITMLCEKHTHDPGAAELILDNPRVVNGSQTLHSIRDVPNPSKDARVMVRIIQIPPIKSSDLPKQITQKKSIINKISIRSNQQNPIKKWNLVATDDFQLDLFRFFKHRGIFYERRDREWQDRSRELKSVGIIQGPTIKKLTQLIASYYWRSSRLGPANAKLKLSGLFDEKAYEEISKTPIELAYQIYLTNSLISQSYRTLSESTAYIRKLKGHVNLSLLSMVIKVFQSAKAKWGNSEWTQLLEEQSEKWMMHTRKWDNFVKACAASIYNYYKKEAALYQQEEAGILTFNNYFKTQKYVSKFLEAPTPNNLVELAQKIMGR